jgi:hypothetical protein
MSPLPKLSDGPVWIIEVRALHPTAYGPALSEWEELTPGKRYTPAEVDEFEDSLALDDMYGFRWRARIHPQFGVHDRRHLFARREFDEFTHRVIPCTLDDLRTMRELCDYPIPAPSAWAYMTATLGAA